MSELYEMVDFVVCFGGDGVIFYVFNLFCEVVFLVIFFNLGLLGFLILYVFEVFKGDLKFIIYGSGVYIILCMRFWCEFFCNGKFIFGKVFEVFNEVVVDCGFNFYFCKIECYE